MNRFIALICAALSGAAFYLSTGMGGTLSTGLDVFWLISFLAPVPVLWLAFRSKEDGRPSEKGWVVFLSAMAAWLIGAVNIVQAYYGVLPAAVLVLAAVVPGLIFAASVLGAWFIAKRLPAILAVIAFAALWTAFDYLGSFGPDGAVMSPAYSQIGMPFNIQIASQFGIWAITFVMAFFAASAAMFAATRQKQFAVLALAVILVNAGYGYWRIAEAPKATSVHVGLAADDSLVGLRFKEDEASVITVVKAYNAAAQSLTARGASLIVFPERLAPLKPEWRSAVNAEFITTAHIGHAMIVAGFDDRSEVRQNVALVYFPNGLAPQRYAKRHLIAGLESVFVPGAASFMLGDRTAVAVCKDMDFPAMIRADAMLQPTLFAVPAWDFDKDAAWHARLAVMRGVENGFAVARAANNGLLTLSDAYGRVVAMRRSSEGGMVLLDGELPRGPGATLYTRIGDAFAWIAAAMSLLLIGVAALAKRR